MDPLEAFGDHRAHPQQTGAFRRPVAAGSGAILLASHHHAGHTLLAVTHGGAVDRHFLTAGHVLGVAALDVGCHLVTDTNVGESAAHHHLMVTAAGTVGIEIDRLHAMALQVMPRRAVRLDRPGRGYVVGGDGIPEQGQHTGVPDWLHIFHFGGEAFEEGRILDVSGLAVPLIGLGIRYRQASPGLVAVEHAGVLAGEHVVVDHHHRILDFLAAGPDVLQIDRLAIVVAAQRVLVQIDPHGTGQGVGHHQRRRCQPVGAHALVYPAFEVAVTREHRRHHQIAFGDTAVDLFRQWAGVTDTGGTAVAHQVESQLVQRVLEAGFAQVVGDHLGARRQRGFHPGLADQPPFHRLLRHQAGGQHDTGVGGIGARSDRGDHHGAVVQVKALAIKFHFHAAGGLVVADGSLPAFALQLADLGVIELQLLGEQIGEGAFYFRHRYPVLGPFRTGQAGDHVVQVQLQGVGEDRIGIGAGAPQALGLAVGFHQVHHFLGAAGEL